MKQVINPAELLVLMSHPDCIVLDASPKENKSNLSPLHSDKRIPGARPFDLKGKFSDHSASMPNTFPSADQFQEGCRALGIDAESRIVVYDNLGMYTAPRVWWMFKVMGHQHVRVLDGGLPAWVEEGMEIEIKSIETYGEGSFVARPDLSVVKTMEDVLANLAKPDYTIVDARSAGRFKGTAPEPRAGLESGHIPDSINIPYADVLDNGKLKNKEELEYIFKDVIAQEKPIVFSCGSGLTACINLLALSTLGEYETSVYDGSWTEWAQLQGDKIRKDTC